VLWWSTPAAGRVGLFRTPELTAGPAAAVVGALLTRSPAGRRIGLLLLVIGLSATTYVAARAAVAFEVAGGRGGGVLADTAVWLMTWTWATGFLPFVLLLPLLLPDGRPPSPAWRPAVLAGAALTALVALTSAVRTDPPRDLPVTNPLGVPALAPVVDAVSAAAVVAAGVLAVVAVAGLLARVRAAGPVERRQLALTGGALAVAVLCSFVAPPVLVHLTTSLVPVSIAVAVVRYRLYDIDVLVHRALVAALLLGAAAVVHAAVVGWAASLLGDRDGASAFAGAVALALLFAPARARATAAVDRLLHGHRADPDRLLADVDARLRTARSPHEALHEVVEAMAVGLRLPGVAVEVAQPDGPPVTARSGDPDRLGAATVPLVRHGEQVGTLVAVPRSGEERLSRLDLEVLGRLAGPVSAVGHALRLTADLERSRSAVVTVREEERRRLRAELHDGLGPQLASAVMLLDTARRAVTRDPGRADRLVGLAKDHVDTAVTEVRRLVQGLRPPALDDLGLVGALRAAVEGDRGDGPSTTVEVEGDLAELPAAVEAAAYRIVLEALTNVTRHAAARTAAVGATVSDVLRAVLVDDHPVFRSGLRVLLEDLGVEVVAEAADGEQGVQAVRAARPDIVLMDLQMPRLNGVDATRQLVEADPDVRVLVLTMVEDDDALFAAVRAGALGYLLKGAGQDEIARAVQGVARGEAVYGPALARRLRAFFTAGAPATALPFPELTDRERDVLDLVAAGHRNAEIARRLFLSDKTVRNHLTAVFAKLQAADRAALIVRARQAGLGGAG